MRKLIIIGIISVVAMIAWIGYLKYDTQQFIKELSSTPEASSLEQQAKDTAKDASVPAPDSTMESTTGHEKVSPLPTEDLRAETSEDVTHPDRLRSNTETGGDVLGSGGTPADTELSPEVVALYTDLQPIYDEYAIVSWEYMQVMTKMHEVSDRKDEITFQLSSNPKARQELRELQEWINANYSTYEELHDEASRRADVMKTFINSRGYSYRDFDWETFFTWRNEPSK